ncbi:MAG: hypothetical protein AMXMBFR64_62880 [Myxococcales bacterium]
MTSSKQDAEIQDLKARYRELEQSMRPRFNEWLGTILAVSGDDSRLYVGGEIVNLRDLGQQQSMFVNHNVLQGALTTKLAAALQNSPNPVALLTRDDQEAAAMKRACDHFLKYQFHAKGAKPALHRAASWAMVCNIAYFGAIWDETAAPPSQVPKLTPEGEPVYKTEKRPVLDEQGQPTMVETVSAGGRRRSQPMMEEVEVPQFEWKMLGDIRYWAPSPFDVFPTRCETWQDCRAMYDRQFWTLEELTLAYGHEATADIKPDVNADDFIKVNDWFDPANTGRKDKYVLVLRFWEMPTIKHPMGRLRVIANRKYLYDGELPCRMLPVAPLWDIPVPWDFFGTSAFAQAVAPQRALNSAEGSIRRDFTFHAHARMIVEESSIAGTDDDSLPSDPDAVIRVKKNAGNWPKPLEQPQLPSWVQQLPGHYKQMVETVAGVHAMTQGQNDGANSGRQVMALEANDSRKWVMFLETYARAAEHGFLLGLKLWRDYGPPEEIVRVYGPGGPAGDVIVFRKGHLEDDNLLVHIDANDMIPYNPELARQQINEAWGAGAIPDQATYWKMQRQGSMSRLIGNGEPSRRRAWEEHELLDEGQAVPVLPFEDHPVHLDEHLEAMRSPEFYKKPPEIQRLWIEHVLATQQAMMPTNLPNPMATGAQPPMSMGEDRGGGVNMPPTMNGAAGQGAMPGTSPAQEVRP